MNGCHGYCSCHIAKLKLKLKAGAKGEIGVNNRKFVGGGKEQKARGGGGGKIWFKGIGMRDNITSGVGGVVLIPVVGVPALGSLCPSNAMGMGKTGVSLGSKALFPTKGLSGSKMDGNGGGTATPSLVTGLEPVLERRLEEGLEEWLEGGFDCDLFLRSRFAI